MFNIKWNQVDWVSTLFIGIYHVVLLAALPFYFYYAPPSLSMWAAMIIVLTGCGLGITMGYHRYFAHQAFKTNPIVEAILVWFGSMATQGSIIRWSFEHRHHHAFVDSDRDPYSINKGFWHAHILWMFKKGVPVDKKVVADLYRKPLVLFQHRHYAFCMLFTSITSFLFVGWLLGDYLGAFVMTWWVRLFLLHHFTWFINSACHYWGTQSYSEEHTAVDNWLLSMVTFGEGYHNYHHTFPNDYRNGIKWYHLDPTKWIVWALSKMGWAWGLRRVNHQRINSQLINMDRQHLIEQLKQSLTTGREAMESRVNEISERLVEEFNEIQKLAAEFRKSKALGRRGRELRQSLKQEIKQMRRQLNEDWRSWKELSRRIRRLEVPA